MRGGANDSSVRDCDVGFDYYGVSCSGDGLLRGIFRKYPMTRKETGLLWIAVALIEMAFVCGYAYGWRNADRLCKLGMDKNVIDSGCAKELRAPEGYCYSGSYIATGSGCKVCP